jgi:hypothetical protein
MGSFVNIVVAINDLKTSGAVKDYAIAGAMAVSFWTEAVATFDLDVLVLLGAIDNDLDPLRPIIRWAAERAYQMEAEHIVIEGVPVQFLPTYNALAEEAVREAKTLDYRGTPIRVVSPEYLIALALDPPAKTARRKERAAMLKEVAHVDETLLDDVLGRYNLSW